MPRLRLTVTGLLLLAPAVGQAGSTLENIRVWSEDGKTRVVLDLSRPTEHNIFTLRGPDRLVVDLKESQLGTGFGSVPPGTGSLQGIRTGLRASGQLRIVLDLNEPVRSRSFTAGPNGQYGDRLVIDLERQGNLHAVKRASEGLRQGRDIVIAVDPGHGGHDPGAVGRARTREKDIALEIGRILAGQIDAEPGMKAVLVRRGDYFVNLRDRIEIARRNKADLFVSIHADSISDRRAKGASVYVLSLKGASDEAAKRLAQRENAADLVGGVSLADKDPVLASVLLDLSQNAALSASLEVGSKVIDELGKIGTVHRYKVQQAGLIVLKSPDVPSILVETNFISNPHEEQRLRDRAYQSRLAAAILAGVRSYFFENPPPDTRLAMDLGRTPLKHVSHVISRGDTLSDIAQRYNVSLTAIRAANHLSNDKIRVGQKLTIPVFAGT